MKISEGKSIILFRLHKEPEVAFERLKIVQHYNPGLEVHVLYGGEEAGEKVARDMFQGSAKTFWRYAQDKPVEWKWRHSDLMLKAWFREVGHSLDFDFLYSYEYDLLTLKPLEQIYPDIDDQTLALAACEPFTEAIENRWTWTSRENERPKFLEFQDYLKRQYGIARQEKVCLGPGPLLPRKFIEAFSETEDIELVHDELAYPAYAQALGFSTVKHGMHPGFGSSEHEERFFNCRSNKAVAIDLILGQMQDPNGVRAFHPVKYLVTLEDLAAI